MFQRSVEEKPEIVEKIVLAAGALHNYLQPTDNIHYTPSAGFVDSEDKTDAIMVGQWRKLINSKLQRLRSIRNS